MTINHVGWQNEAPDGGKQRCRTSLKYDSGDLHHPRDYTGIAATFNVKRRKEKKEKRANGPLDDDDTGSYRKLVSPGSTRCSEKAR